MKYQLIKEVNRDYTALEQVLTNRGLKREDIPHYINTTDDDINSFLGLGEENLKAAASALVGNIQSGNTIGLIVDSDCDGFTSSALLINYLYDIFPAWVEGHLIYYIHDGKQHGLSDFCDILIEQKYPLVIVPDAGSNDYEYHKKLKESGCQVIVLDHHEAESISEDAIIINNQLSDYHNKHLYEVEVTRQI